MRLAEENGRWGHGKITGELNKLGLVFSESTIRNVLNRNGILPTPVRKVFDNVFRSEDIHIIRTS